MLDAGQVHCIIRVQIKERIKNNKGWTTGLRVILWSYKNRQTLGCTVAYRQQNVLWQHFLCNPVLSVDHLECMQCVMRWKMVSDSPLTSICWDARVHRTEASPVGRSTCTAGGVHGSHMPLLTHTAKPNKPVCQLSPVVTTVMFARRQRPKEVTLHKQNCCAKTRRRPKQSRDWESITIKNRDAYFVWSLSTNLWQIHFKSSSLLKIGRTAAGHSQPIKDLHIKQSPALTEASTSHTGAHILLFI